MNNELITEDSLLAMRWKEQVMYLAEHGAEERFIRALIRTKPESEWSVLENERTKHLFKTGDRDEIRESITSQLKEDGFFTCYDILDPDRKPEDILPPSSIEEHTEDFEA